MTGLRAHTLPFLLAPGLLMEGACTPMSREKSPLETGAPESGSSEEGVGAGPLWASLEVEVEADERPVCGSAEVQATLSTSRAEGVTVLKVDVDPEGAGWTVEEPTALLTPPYKLEVLPGDPVTLNLQTTGGTSTLLLTLGDGTTVREPLLSTSDEPPTISLYSPADRLLPDEDEVEVVVEVRDDQTPSSELWVEWGVSEVGVLMEGGYDPEDDLFHLVLARDTLPLGLQDLRVRASDGCDPTEEGAPDTEAWFELCQDGRIEGESLELEDFEIYWDAADPTDEGIQLTSSVRNQVGAAFYEIPVDLTNLHFTFGFEVGQSSAAAYGSGLALVLLDSHLEDRLSAPPSDDQIDCGLGYAQVDCDHPEAAEGLGPLVIELDDRYNDGIDPTEFDHAELVWWGDPVGHSLTWSTLSELEDGLSHEAELDLRPDAEGDLALRFWVDGRLELEWTFAASDLDYEARVGFTAGTPEETTRSWEGESQTHLVRDVRNVSFACDDFTN